MVSSTWANHDPGRSSYWSAHLTICPMKSVPELNYVKTSNFITRLLDAEMLEMLTATEFAVA